MNIYTMRARGIRSKSSIIYEMLLYGFSEEDIRDLCPAKISLVNSVVMKLKTETLFKKARVSHESRYYSKLLQSRMFAVDEMDYGGSPEYTWETLGPRERQLEDKPNHNELKIYGKTEEDVETDGDI